MKKIQLLIATVLGIFAVVSCEQEIGGPETAFDTTVINASIESTKTALGEKDGTAWPNYWKAGDQISINGVASEALDAEADGKSSASFSFSGAVATPYYAAYPAAAVSDYSNGSATITVPASQSYVAGSYDPAAFVMFGKSETESSVALAPFVSVFHLSLTGSASITSVKLTGGDGAALSGSFSTDFETAEPKTVSNVVELVADAPVALPAEFFICVPAGLSGPVVVKISDSDGGSKSVSANIKSPLVAGVVYSPAALAYAASSDLSISAEGITSSTAIICVDGVPANAYTFNVYSDEGCSALVDSYAVDAGNSCWGEAAPRFCISGLEPSTTYYVKVLDVTGNAESAALPVTTKAFTIVEVSSAPAGVGDVILAEDFGELRWDGDVIGNGAGWFPTSEAQSTSFGTVEVGSFQAAATSNEKQISAQTDPVAASRLAHWAQGANPHMYVHPGYIKLVGQNKVTHIVTPALDNIPEGMLATVEVEVTASAYYSESSGSFATKDAIVAVQAPGEYNELSSETKTNTLDLESKIASITLTEESAWNTYKVTLSGVAKGARLAFGAEKSVTGNDARMNISDIKVTIKALDEDLSFISIDSEAKFQQFVNLVAGGNKTLEARLTVASTLSLSSAAVSAFNSIEDYEGTFDGNGKTISGLTKPMFATLYGTVKNLTLNSTVKATDADDVNWGILAKVLYSGAGGTATVQGCTANGSITYTPASALEKDCQIGGLIGNNKGGTITNCVNSAKVVLDDNGQVNASQSSVGGVVGRTQKSDASASQGNITNCSNSGSVISNAVLSENIYIGGVLGYQVEKKESISGCVNGGIVKVGATGSTTKALHIGGVIGMGKGLIESCTNLSDGVVTTEEGSSAGTYLCQGGVVGRLNREADSYAGLTNNGTVNVAAKGGREYRLIGGVVGRCEEGAAITEFTNSGNINYSSTDTLATYIGGVVASNKVKDIVLDGCNSTGGVLTYSGSTAHGPLYVGGVVGYSTQPVSGCTNAMTLNIGGEFAPTSNQYFSFGGVVGKMTGNSISDCLNTGNITYSQEISGSNGYTFVGGIVGHIKGDIVDSSNGGTVTITGKNSAQNPFYGGVVGSTDSAIEHSITGKYETAPATNYGSVVVNTEGQSNKYVYVGGVAGRLHTNGSMSATNAGAVTVSKLTCTTLYLGGVTGLANGPVDSASNSGDVVAADGVVSKQTLYFGGVVGRAEKGMSSCTNSGLVSSGASVTTSDKYYIQVGGVVGYNHTDAPLSNCHNTGNVANTGSSTAYVYVGGVTSESAAAITSCYNTGAVSNSGSSDNKHPVCVGGIAGVISGVTVTSSYNAGAVSNTGVGSGTSPVGTCVGGFAGYIYGEANLGGTDSNYNYNAGTVMDTSESTYIAVGGFVGECDGDGINLSYVKNLDTGDIMYADNTRYNSYVGGVVGCVNAPLTMDYASNAGDISFRNITVSHQVWLGGVIGGFNAGNDGIKGVELTLTGLTNTGNIDCPQEGGNGANMAIDMEKKPTAYSYVGGISGVGDCGNKEFLNCTCSGDITVYNQLKTRLGGIAGFLNVNPTGSAYTNNATIIYYRFNPAGLDSSTNGVIGGIVGYMDIGTVHDLTFWGRLQTTGSSPNCFTGGIVGQLGKTCAAFHDCNIYAPTNIVGAGSGSFGSTGAGLFASKSSSSAFDFTGCKVKKGTKVQKITITEENMAEAVIGRQHASEVTNPPALVDEF